MDYVLVISSPLGHVTNVTTYGGTNHEEWERIRTHLMPGMILDIEPLSTEALPSFEELGRPSYAIC